MTLESDEATQDAMDLITRHDEGVNQASSYLASVWNAKASPDRGAHILVAGLAPPGAPFGANYRFSDPSTIIPSEEMLAVLLEVTKEIDAGPDAVISPMAANAMKTINFTERSVEDCMMGSSTKSPQERTNAVENRVKELLLLRTCNCYRALRVLLERCWSV